MNKLTKLIHNFQEKHGTKKYQQRVQDYQILRSYLPKIFPNQTLAAAFLKIFKDSNEQNHERYFVENIVIHTRDDKWMSHYIDQYIKSDNRHPENKKIKFSTIESFVDFDMDYKNERDQYELNIMRAEIIATMTEKSQSIHDDEDFREMIIYQGICYGIPKLQTEISLEKNANLWHEQMMFATYYHQYIQSLCDLSEGYSDEVIYDKMKRIYPLWKELHEKSYYDMHRSVIKSSKREITKNMVMYRDVELQKIAKWEALYKAITTPILKQLYRETEKPLTQSNQAITGEAGVEQA